MRDYAMRDPRSFCASLRREGIRWRVLCALRTALGRALRYAGQLAFAAALGAAFGAAAVTAAQALQCTTHQDARPAPARPSQVEARAA